MGDRGGGVLRGHRDRKSRILRWVRVNVLDNSVANTQEGNRAGQHTDMSETSLHEQRT